MFSITVRGHMMIAHSLSGQVFGPAQRLHGATYVVDVEFRRPELDADGIVIDIGLASDALGRILRELSFRNLDEEAEFKGRNTTTEFLAHVVFERLQKSMAAGELGKGGSAVASMRVTLHESHIAAGSYDGEVFH